jgi:spermidine/putrescine transport system ATP-binding protein
MQGVTEGLNGMSEARLSIELRKVCKQFGDSYAVKDLNLEIRKGEFFSFLGPSGCGKTTTLRMIGGFEQPTSGQILLEGQPIEGTPPYARNVNTVFQSYALFPHMNILDNVGFGLKMKGVTGAEMKERAMHALETVKLKGFEARRPGQLSGGQRQRVALARAIVNRPAVLLLDEPLAALDLKLRRAMQIELKELQSNLGITFVFVTHDQEEALTISDRIAVMSQGVFEQVGSPTEIYETPRSKFVADFIGTTNFIEGTVEVSTSQQLLVKTRLGVTLKANPDTELAVGKSVVISVRPEKILLGSQPGPRDNHLEGTLYEIIYLGTATHYIIKLPQGQLMTVFAQNGSDFTQPLRVNAPVSLTFNLEHCRTLEH